MTVAKKAPALIHTAFEEVFCYIDGIDSKFFYQRDEAAGRRDFRIPCIQFTTFPDCRSVGERRVVVQFLMSWQRGKENYHSRVSILVDKVLHCNLNYRPNVPPLTRLDILFTIYVELLRTKIFENWQRMFRKWPIRTWLRGDKYHRRTVIIHKHCTTV